MLKRDRDGAIAFGLGLAFLAVFGLGLWSGISPDRQPHNSTPERQHHEAPSPQGDLAARDAFWLSHSGDSESYEAICDQPIDHDQADLCQQWRSAERATEIAFFTKLQLAFGLFGIFGLIITIIYSRKATIAATKGVRVALSANRAASRMGEAQMRAYVAITSAQLRGVGKISTPNVNIQFGNNGQTPASHIQLQTVVAALPEDYNFDLSDIAPKAQPTLGPGQKFVNTRYLQPNEWATVLNDLKKPGRSLYAYGRMTYRDAFGREWRTDYKVMMALSDGATIDDGHFAFCKDGNNAT